MAGFKFNLPKISQEGLSDKKYTKRIANYLMSLEENLRYTFANLDDENMTQDFIDSLTAGNILVTNGVNSIILNPDDGFKMIAGNKIRLSFDLTTGKSEFNGDIIGGLIRSANYESGTSGMEIDLEDGTWDSVGFKYNGTKCEINGKLSSVGTTYTVTIDNGIISAGYLDLAAGTNEVWATATEINVKNASRYVRITPNDITWHSNDLMSGGTFLTTDNFQYSMDGVNGSFTTADGKTVTVYDGVITDIF